MVLTKGHKVSESKPVIGQIYLVFVKEGQKEKSLNLQTEVQDIEVQDTEVQMVSCMHFVIYFLTLNYLTSRSIRILIHTLIHVNAGSSL